MVIPAKCILTTIMLQIVPLLLIFSKKIFSGVYSHDDSVNMPDNDDLHTDP